MKRCAATIALLLLAGHAVGAADSGQAWTLKNKSVEVGLRFQEGSLRLVHLVNRGAGGIDYLADATPIPMFTLETGKGRITAHDGGWTLASGREVPVEAFGRVWGRRLELTMTRSAPVEVTVRQVVELYGDTGGLRVCSFLKNEADQPLAITASDVLALDLPDDPHQLHYVTGNLHWNTGTAGLHRGGRNAIACYDAGGGWFVVPENNWATCLVPGAAKGDSANKFLTIHVWDNEPNIRVSTNPAAVQLTLFHTRKSNTFPSTSACLPGMR